MLNKILILSLILFFITPVDAYARDRIPNHLRSLFESTDMNVLGISDVTIFYENFSAVSDERVETAQDIIINLKEHLNYDSVPHCQNLSVKMFLLDYNTINDRDVMHFLTWSDWGNINIWGAYDSFHNQSTAELYINMGVAETRFIKTIAHEFYHHFQDLTCGEEDEQAAVRFADEFCDIFDEC